MQSRHSFDEFARAAIGAGLLCAWLAATWVFADRRDALTNASIRLALIEYAAALWLMVSLGPGDWRALTPRGRWARQLWSWACVTFLVHVGCAFQFTHGWSHAQAFEETRLESGFGEGLYVNYVFMAAWIGDALWWWISPARYVARSVWWVRVLHGFMLLIAFNATVVFETGPVRWVGAGVSAALLIRWMRIWR